MNSSKNMMKLFLGLVAVAGVAASAGGASTNSAPARLEPVRSVFVMPTKPQEGRDPFFPESIHPYAKLGGATNGASPTGISALSFRGVVGTPGNYVAIINSRPFKTGEEGEVRSSGGVVHLRCVEVRAQVVVVEINGQKYELALNAKLTQ